MFKNLIKNILLSGKSFKSKSLFNAATLFRFTETMNPSTRIVLPKYYANVNENMPKEYSNYEDYENDWG